MVQPETRYLEESIATAHPGQSLNNPRNTNKEPSATESRYHHTQTDSMSNVSGIMESEDVVRKETLVRRVSNILKDGSNSGPPLLFRHASMQRIRHCCQNLNLFPYLLYSVDNSKSHPIPRKVHVCLGQLLRVIVARVFHIYQQLRHSLLRGIQSDDFQSKQTTQTDDVPKPPVKFQRVVRRKPKQSCSLYLTLAIYLAPLVLFCQLIGLFSIMVVGKYTPGFIFLTSALLFLGCISLKIMFYESTPRTAKHKKDKAL
ncbi:uncharacterized protein LOC116427052 isoform X2 [Nomia melanderi]|uniref:uncharacterized protein LOC116427052 isoform X2 n=1 Tax=Nomia melanderi TaxID=2448451 RepID=UPI001304505A|nr:uncharacterized protein LOC116427052 isoform X2 [Nomia melanderi]